MKIQGDEDEEDEGEEEEEIEAWNVMFVFLYC